MGPLGFLRLSEVTNGEVNSSGNEGLKDQRNAIKWVKENISSTLSIVTPVFASRGVSGIDSLTFFNSSLSTLIPVINPETQITSALDENTALFALIANDLLSSEVANSALILKYPFKKIASISQGVSEMFDDDIDVEEVNKLQNELKSLKNQNDSLNFQLKKLQTLFDSYPFIL